MLLFPAAMSRKLALLGVAVFATVILFYFSPSFTAYFAPEGLPAFGAKTSLHNGDGNEMVEVVSDDGPRTPFGIENEVEKALPGSGKGNGLLEATTSAMTRQSQSMTTRHPSISSIRPSSSASSEPSRTPQAIIQSQIQQLRQGWNPPSQVPEHWPPYQWYANQDYDPNRWEGFEWENDYYINNGVKRFTRAEARPTPYLPYPAYNSKSWSNDWKGEYVPCHGARGKLLNDSLEDMVYAWPSLPDGFPEIAIGDADAVGIDVEHCFDRYNRYGPYGYGQRGRRKIDHWTRPVIKPDWSSIIWGDLQNECLKSNKNRYIPSARHSIELTPDKDLPESASVLSPGFSSENGPSTPPFSHRYTHSHMGRLQLYL